MIRGLILAGLIGLSICVASNALAFDYPVIAPYFETGPNLTPGLPDDLDDGKLAHYPATIRWSVQRFWERTNGYNDYIYGAAKGYQIANNLIRAIMIVESGGVHTRASSAGAIGLMQIKYTTAKSLGYPGAPWELFTPEHNIYIGTKYLRMQSDRYQGDIPDIVNAYFQGSVFRWNKHDVVLDGVNRTIAQRYGHMSRLDGPYVHEAYGPYYEEYYVKRVLKWYDIFNDVIVTQ